MHHSDASGPQTDQPRRGFVYADWTWPLRCRQSQAFAMVFGAVRRGPLKDAPRARVKAARQGAPYSLDP